MVLELVSDKDNESVSSDFVADFFPNFITKMKKNCVSDIVHCIIGCNDYP